MTTKRALPVAATLLSVTLFPSSPFAAPRHWPWSAPINLGAPINSPFAESGATLSKDGSSLYFGSSRPCGDGDAVLDFNLWVARRTSAEAPWGEPECLSINADGTADCEAGQRGYMERLHAYNPDPDFKVVRDAHVPGAQGTTYSGRAAVPDGQTFDRNPQIGPRLPAEVDHP